MVRWVSKPGSVLVIVEGRRANRTAAASSTKLMASCTTINALFVLERVVAAPSRPFSAVIRSNRNDSRMGANAEAAVAMREFWMKVRLFMWIFMGGSLLLFGKDAEAKKRRPG